MYSTVRRLILLGFLVCLSLACGGGQSSDQLVSSTEKITEDQSSKETSGANLIPPGSSGGGSNIASNTPSKGAIANGGTERSSTSLPMLEFFDPTEDGFGFTNFAGGSGAATIGVNDLVELFGSDGLCIPGDSGICEPYPGVDLFLGQLNAVLANGLCYGISASVTNHFSGDRILGGIGPETKALVDLNRGDELDHSIAKLHMMQFSEEYRAALDTYLDDRPDEIARELKASFEDPGNGSTPPYTLALYTDEGGHAITPIGIEETESGYRVSVYDSNWPRETRWVDMDGDSWEYQGSAVLITEDKNSGGGLWTGQGAGTMALIPHAFPDDGFDCFFCQETGSGLSKSTGSVIMVNAQDIKNTTFEMASDDGQEMTWTTSGRSGRLESVKTYILPSQSESLDGGSDILMVVVPPEVNNFEVNLTPLNGSNEEIDQADSFGLVLVGPGIPTTVTKGHILEAPEEDSTNIIEFSKDPLTDTVVLSIDSEKVETIESATIQSTTFVELASDERYEAIIVEDALDDVVVAQKETAEVVFSLKAILDDVETPLRTTETGDGLRFSKFSDGSVTVESPDNDLINKTVDAGYEVTFSDGTTASFQISEDRAMIGNFSDGSTSIRFKSGNGVHSTADGWVINEPTRGEYEVLRENLEGVLERPSLDALAQNFTIAAETKEMMRDLIFDEESQRDPKNDPLFGVEGDVGVADVVSVNTERAEILYDKYELLKQVREVIALETQDIGSNVFVQATLGSMETTDWSVKLEAEQKSWADEMETAEAIVVAEQETSAESTSETTGEAESESEANAAERETKLKEWADAVTEAAAERETRAEEIAAAETQALEDREAKREIESEARLKDWADAVAKAGVELEARIKDIEPVEAKTEVEREARVKEIETAQAKATAEREAKVKEWADAAAKVQTDLKTTTNDKEDNSDGIESTVEAEDFASEATVTDNGNSSAEATATDDGNSSTEATATDDGNSSTEATAADDGNSSTEATATDDGNSNPEESGENSDEGQSSGNTENIPDEIQERIDEMRERSSQR